MLAIASMGFSVPVRVPVVIIDAPKRMNDGTLKN